MQCPKCQATDTNVIDSRSSGQRRRRRRQCGKCKHRFTTTEVYGTLRNRDFPLPFTDVQKRDGKISSFDEEKLTSSIEHACARLVIGTEDKEALISDINDLIRNEQSPIMVQRIVDICISELTKVNKIAAVRYATQYADFDGHSQIAKFITKLPRK